MPTNHLDSFLHADLMMEVCIIFQLIFILKKSFRCLISIQFLSENQSRLGLKEGFLLVFCNAGHSHSAGLVDFYIC